MFDFLNHRGSVCEVHGDCTLSARRGDMIMPVPAPAGG